MTDSRAVTPWKAFELKATLGERTETERIVGQATYSTMKMADNDEQTAIQFDATMEAIGRILNKAINSALWAKGQIQLIDPDTGEVLHEMDAKEVDNG